MPQFLLENNRETSDSACTRFGRGTGLGVPTKFAVPESDAGEGAALRDFVRVPAFLHGTADRVGVHAMCTLEIWSEQSSHGRLFTRCRITGEPEGLPDGPYVLEFDSRKVTTKKNEGLWALTLLGRTPNARTAAGAATPPSVLADGGLWVIRRCVRGPRDERAKISPGYASGALWQRHQTRRRAPAPTLPASHPGMRPVWTGRSRCTRIQSGTEFPAERRDA